MRRCNSDPRWIVARRAGIDANGQGFSKGERVFYYPATGSILAGEAAQVAAAGFEAEAADEDLYAQGRG